MTATQYDGYRRLLEGVPVSELAGALDRCLRESVFMPRPAEILAAAGRSPEAMADRALTEALAWVEEWGPGGRRDAGEPAYEYETLPNGATAVRTVHRQAANAPALPCRTERALSAMAGSRKRALERLIECEPEPERYARFRKEFVAAWREARSQGVVTEVANV